MILLKWNLALLLSCPLPSEPSSVSIILPFFVTWMTSIMSSILPVVCLLSIRFWANFYLLLMYLKSHRCSSNLTLNGLPVCPVYFILHSGHVSWYTPLLSYLLWGVSCFIVRRFSIVLSVVNAIFTSTGN